jgi:hypothetical protein
MKSFIYLQRFLVVFSVLCHFAINSYSQLVDRDSLTINNKLNKIINQLDSLTKKDKPQLQSVGTLSLNTTSIPIHYNAAITKRHWVTCCFRKGVMLSIKSNNFLFIDSISLLIKDGYIVEINVFSDNKKFENKGAPIEITSSRLSKGDLLYNIFKPNESISLTDILLFNSFNSYTADDGYYLLNNTKKSITLNRKIYDLTDSSNLDITYLNAFNFDFSGNTSPSYLGLFNVFAPTTRLFKNKKWGFMAGIEKINYSNGNINGNDSNQIEYFVQNLVNRFDATKNMNNNNYTVRDSASYSKQYNEYTYSSKNTVWSFYFEPTYRLTHYDPSDPKAGLYLHLHFELLVNDWSRTANIQNIQDTALVNAGSNTLTPNSKLLFVSPTQIVSNYNFLTGCFGAGFTFYCSPFKSKKIHFLFQPTFGMAVNAPDFNLIDNPENPPAPNGTFSGSVTDSYLSAFYLIRSSFIETFSSSIQFVLGINIRGQFPSNNPQYAAYAGVNLDLMSLEKLFTTP